MWHNFRGLCKNIFPVLKSHCAEFPKYFVQNTLTHWGQDKMAAILQPIFSHAFSWMKMYEFQLKFHWSLFFRVTINNIPALVQIMAQHQQGNRPLSEPMMFRLPTNICVTQLQWVKSALCLLMCSHFLSIFNILRPRQNGRHFAADIFTCIFLNENVWISIKISLKFLPKGPINIIRAANRYWISVFC